jgi:hypothetical protein
MAISGIGFATISALRRVCGVGCHALRNEHLELNLPSHAASFVCTKKAATVAVPPQAVRGEHLDSVRDQSQLSQTDYQAR